MTSRTAPAELRCHVADDPAGVALLLAGPVAGEWWDDADVVLAAPRRTGTGFAVPLVVNGTGARPGTILVVPTMGGSEVRLTLASGTPTSIVDAAARFLSRLAADAQGRSPAA